MFITMKAQLRSPTEPPSKINLYEPHAMPSALSLYGIVNGLNVLEWPATNYYYGTFWLK